MSAVCARSPRPMSRRTIRARLRPRSIACSPHLRDLRTFAPLLRISTGHVWLRSWSCEAPAAMRNGIRTSVRPLTTNPLQSRDDLARIRHAMAAHLLLPSLPMVDSPRFDVSVILPFGDDEEAVG